MATTDPMMRALERFSPLSRVARESILNITKIHQYPKGHHLLRIGQIDRHFHYIEKGAGRVYYLRDGLDVSDYFALDDQFLGGLESLFTQQPSHKAMELLEDSVVHSFKVEDFENLCRQQHEIERLGRMMATFGFLNGQRRVESIRFLSVAERYEELENQYPGISNRVPLKHIASYLGTTQVSLSRIRSARRS